MSTESMELLRCAVLAALVGYMAFRWGRAVATRDPEALEERPDSWR